MWYVPEINSSEKTDKVLKLKKNKTLWPVFWMGFNSLKAAEPLRRDSLLFTIQLPGVSGIQLIDLGRLS